MRAIFASGFCSMDVRYSVLQSVFYNLHVTNLVGFYEVDVRAPKGINERYGMLYSHILITKVVYNEI